MDAKPYRFIEEQIEVQFVTALTLEKTPLCPIGFTWQGEDYRIIELLAEWHDYTRRGRMARNMRPEHAETAGRRGSWGVGQFFFRVRTHEERIFDIYYDRAPKDASHRKGAWFLYQELLLE
jgi:hypothetical protein